MRMHAKMKGHAVQLQEEKEADLRPATVAAAVVVAAAEVQARVVVLGEPDAVEGAEPVAANGSSYMS
jgi:hypothetical protein